MRKFRSLESLWTSLAAYSNIQFSVDNTYKPDIVVCWIHAGCRCCGCRVWWWGCYSSISQVIIGRQHALFTRVRRVPLTRSSARPPERWEPASSTPRRPSWVWTTTDRWRRSTRLQYTPLHHVCRPTDTVTDWRQELLCSRISAMEQPTDRDPEERHYVRTL